jgi:hypothetical protein
LDQIRFSIYPSAHILNFQKKKIMSHAFVKEGDSEWLHEIAPTLSALISFLKRENNNLSIHEKKRWFDEGLNRELHEMSDGLTYFINDKKQWETLD